MNASGRVGQGQIGMVAAQESDIVQAHDERTHLVDAPVRASVLALDGHARSPRRRAATTVAKRGDDGARHDGGVDLVQPPLRPSNVTPLSISHSGPWRLKTMEHASPGPAEAGGIPAGTPPRCTKSR